MKRVSAFLQKPIAVPLLLLTVAILAYGLLIPQMGFYWDELPMSWIRYELGPAALTRYFSTNRPVWGLLYQLTTRLLPQVPFDWEIFCLFWRWVTAVLVWGIVRELWPNRRVLAITVSLLFLLYPGFTQQWTSFLYSHFFIVLSFVLFSFLCMLWSFRQASRYWPLTILAVIASGLNLWMMEYFFTLELFRLFLILYVVYNKDTDHRPVRLVRQAFVYWSPFLIVFISNVAWRLFVFNNKIYQPTLIPKLKTAPLSTLGELIRTALTDLFNVSAAAWWQVFHLPSPAVDGPRTLAFYAIVVLLTGSLVGAILTLKNQQGESSLRPNLWVITLGIVAMLCAGGPFWLTGLDITLADPANRFTLPFMLGVSLVLAGLLMLLPKRLHYVVTIGFIALAAGRQAMLADAYRRDWVTQKTMFWQMHWRAPGIAPNTMVFLNEGALQFYADNSLTGALNWIYDPNNRSSGMDYVMFYPTSRQNGTLTSIEPGKPITYDFISEVFHGNTSESLAFYFQPPGCLRLLDPQIDSANHFIPDETLMRDTAHLSSSNRILPSTTGLMPDLYGPEPPHGWCYYFEQADLAGQYGNWARVVELADTAFGLNDYPNDPVERFVFIEGFAQENNWNRANDLAHQSYKVSPNYVRPLLCDLFHRMDREIPSSIVKESSLNDLNTKFSCLP